MAELHARIPAVRLSLSWLPHRPEVQQNAGVMFRCWNNASTQNRNRLEPVSRFWSTLLLHSKMGVDFIPNTGLPVCIFEVHHHHHASWIFARSSSFHLQFEVKNETQLLIVALFLHVALREMWCIYGVAQALSTSGISGGHENSH